MSNEKGRNHKKRKPNSKNRNVSEDRSKKTGFKTSGSYNKNPNAKSATPNTRPKHSAGGAAKRSADGKVRLNRFLAQAGICSRREADVLIETGVVSVNGKTVVEMGLRIDPQKDIVHYGGDKVNVERLQYVILNKPKDFITTAKDPQDRKTVLDLVSNACIERIYPVGQLDRNTVGVMLFTNDGNLADRLTHPKSNINQVYQIEVEKNIKMEHMQQMHDGFEIDDSFTKLEDIQYGSGGSVKSVAVITIRSTRNRILRRMFEKFGYTVKRLDRLAFAEIDKKRIPRGTWRHLTPEEVAVLKQL